MSVDLSWESLCSGQICDDVGWTDSAAHQDVGGAARTADVVKVGSRAVVADAAARAADAIATRALAALPLAVAVKSCWACSNIAAGDRRPGK